MNPAENAFRNQRTKNDDMGRETAPSGPLSKLQEGNVMAPCFSFITIALVATVLASATHAAEPGLDTANIEAITGLTGVFNQTENVFKISKPRNDIAVTVDRWTLPPFVGITSYAAFMPMAGKTMVMGDTVLLEDEVNPAMSAALEAGLEVTALHNHFFFDQPRVYFMHIAGMGEGQRLAAAVRAVYDRVDQVRAAHAANATSFPGAIASPSRISAVPIEEVFGTAAQTSAGMVKVTLGRTAWMHGVEIGNEMGVNTWAAFAGSDQEAVVDGDFAVIEGDLQGVLKILRGEGINIVAIHQHMTQETPRYVFLHYWGKGKAIDLARAVKKAVNSQQPNKYD